MSFSLFETSRSKGAPVELYRFRYGVFETDAFCYTNAEKPIVHMNLTYMPISLKRGKIISSTENGSKTPLELFLPASAGICDLFRVTAPPGQIALTIFQGHSRDPDGEFLAIWVGRVTACTRQPDTNDAKLMCESAKSQLRRIALRRHYQYMCPHVLYGDQCRASETAATTVGQIGTVNGRLITMATLYANPDRYVGGMLKWTDANQVTRARTIIAVAVVNGVTRFTISGVDDDLVDGMTVNCIRGCSHTVDGCLTHNNILNFGGQPFIPTKNPLGVYGAFS
ncbi:hypothetical protein GOD54_23650 [Sinorhizobium medicae]|nr:hypothetical protein [Sinorhizobium medicae]